MAKNDKFTEFVDIEYINKKLNKTLIRETLAKKGLTPIGKYIKSAGGATFIYSKTKANKLIKSIEAENKVITEHIIDLNGLSQEKIDAISRFLAVEIYK